MAVLLLLSYAAICVMIFKILRVSINKWTVSTAGIGGIVIVGGLLLGMNYNHPFTTDARLYFYATPVVPTVKGPVVEVPVQANVPLKKGDVLFRVDPRPYQYVVDQKKAALAAAVQNVESLKAALDQASAVVERSKAEVKLAQLTFDRQNELLGKGFAAQSAVDTARRNLDAGNQSLAEAEAGEQRARIAYNSQINGVNTTVAQLTADLRDAEYDLDQTTQVAPTDGYVTQLFLKTGMMASPSSPPTMVFVGNERSFSAAFSQAVMQRIGPGQGAEIAFKSIPGRVFQGKVRVVLDAVSQGQLQPTGTLLDPESRAQSPGLISVNIDIVDDIGEYKLPAGATAEVAIYSDHWRPVAVIRRVLIRMKSWVNYLV